MWCGVQWLDMSYPCDLLGDAWQWWGIDGVRWPAAACKLISSASCLQRMSQSTEHRMDGAGTGRREGAPACSALPPGQQSPTHLSLLPVLPAHSLSNCVSVSLWYRSLWSIDITRAAPLHGHQINHIKYTTLHCTEPSLIKPMPSNWNA